MKALKVLSFIFGGQCLLAGLVFLLLTNNSESPEEVASLKIPSIVVLIVGFVLLVLGIILSIVSHSNNGKAISKPIKGYKASPLLKKMDELLTANIDDEEETLSFIYDAYIFIGQFYRRMGRFSVSAIIEEKGLDIALKLYCNHGKKANDVDTLLRNILVDRNYYVDDDCLDVLDKVRGTHLIEPETIKKIDDSVMMRRRSLKHDPIEMSEEYLSVIDEVEEKIDQNRTLYGMGACHEIWALKYEYLLEKGIDWKSPQVLNPRVMFD